MENQSETRRSARLALNIPVYLSREHGPPVQGIAIVVNRHGALVSSTILCQENDVLSITNIDTDEVAFCRVTYVGAPSSNCKQRIGIEFVCELPGFWGATYETMAALNAVDEAKQRLQRRSEERSLDRSDK